MYSCAYDCEVLSTRIEIATIEDAILRLNQVFRSLHRVFKKNALIGRPSVADS